MALQGLPFSPLSLDGAIESIIIVLDARQANGPAGAFHPGQKTAPGSMEFGTQSRIMYT
jgi:hypothetical protein